MKLRQILTLITLMTIGELIFLLPFVITRIFRPTFLKVFDITNLELGTAFSLYGLIAMVAYFFGGPLADRLSPRKLLPISFVATALGGVVMAFIPSVYVLSALYGFWGLTTILLFWAAYVKAQRELGVSIGQGKSFGSIDAGRGLVAAIMASSTVFLLDAFLPVSADEASLQQMSDALSKIILVVTAMTALGAFLAWVFLPKEGQGHVTPSLPQISLEGVKLALKKRSVWMQALIVLCSYVGYKSIDDYSLYASVVLGYDDVESAQLASISFWLRPIAAVLAGFLGDRFLHSNIITACFALMALGTLSISSGFFIGGASFFIFMTIVMTSAAVYGLRGLYFALFEESKVPLTITGSVAGIVSVIGYTPDVFMGPMMGYTLDTNPGASGHEIFFGIVAVFAIIGLVATLLFKRSVR
ncbi:MAG: MFS transporter [Cyclobacteriaceae bacterium]